MLAADMDRARSWVVSGSLMVWGDAFIPRFDLVVFLRVPAEVRMARLLARERARYGEEILPGGRMHAQHLAFVDWARGYDQPGFTGRSLERHRAWIAALPCPVLEIAGAPPLEESLQRVIAALGAGSA